VSRVLLRSDAFVRAAQKYVKKNPQSASDIHSALKMLAADAFQAQLKSHKLKGNLEGLWACSAGYNLRIIFRFASWRGKEAILLETMGTHDEVY
jgi:mRNA-degrading endonuclease YafQ of YafQ-DinJ toxin-antitoxin module